MKVTHLLSERKHSYPAYVGLTCLLLGVVLGWLLRGTTWFGEGGVPPAAPVGTVQSVLPLVQNPAITEGAGNVSILGENFNSLGPADRITRVLAYEKAVGRSFVTRSYLASAYLEAGDAEATIDTLLGAALLVHSAEDQLAFEGQLAISMDHIARGLIGANQIEKLDGLYERVTLALPELADYLLELGILRISTGDPTGALAVLAQIENHSRLGARARSLMAEAEVEDRITPVVAEAIPLRNAGSQFVVEAVIDGAHRVSLLIDTGAAMTVVDAGVLARLGYPMDGPRQYFGTAGGVVEAPVIPLNHLALGNSGRSHLAVGGLALDMPQGIDGLLGMNYLRHFEFRIDQRAGLLHLTRDLDSAQ